MEGFSRNPCQNESFEVERGGQRTTVYDYFTRKTGKRLNGRSLCVTVKQGRNYKSFPVELCVLLAGQKPKVESDRHKAALIRASAEPAPRRLEKIKRMVGDESVLGDPELDKVWNLKIDNTPMEAEGTVLEAPTLLAGDDREIKVNTSCISIVLHLNHCFRSEMVSGR